jgi:hypothetical protein
LALSTALSAPSHADHSAGTPWRRENCWLPAGEGEALCEFDHLTVLLLPQHDC